MTLDAVALPSYVHRFDDGDDDAYSEDATQSTAVAMVMGDADGHVILRQYDVVSSNSGMRHIMPHRVDDEDDYRHIYLRGGPIAHVSLRMTDSSNARLRVIESLGNVYEGTFRGTLRYRVSDVM